MSKTAAGMDMTSSKILHFLTKYAARPKNNSPTAKTICIMFAHISLFEVPINSTAKIKCDYVERKIIKY